MSMARVMARRSTCSRAQVGAVVALDGRILSTGYNGAPAGMPHCDHTQDVCLCVGPLVTLTCQVHGGCRTAVHDVMNAVAFAARNGVALNGAAVYTTLTPCLVCAWLIVNSGIVSVVASATYRDLAGVELLLAAGVGYELRTDLA